MLGVGYPTIRGIHLAIDDRGNELPVVQGLP